MPAEANVVSGKTVYDMALREDAKSLEEVVVVGYGVQRKSVLTSAVSRVTGDELDKGSPTNIENALKGKVSGVMITSESGQPGASSKVRIRSEERSDERRVGKECRSRWSPYHYT